jgi:DNA-binding HxlR family transcriptional regulator
MTERFVDLLGDKYKGEVLEFLKENQGDLFSINEITGHTSGSNPSVKKFLQELADLGIVKFRKKPNSYLVEYNVHSRYDDVIREMLKADISDLWEDAVHFAQSLMNDYSEQIESVILFDSVARGTADSNSDIDILVLIPDKVTKSELKPKIMDRARNTESEAEIVPIIQYTSGFRENYVSDDRFSRSVVRDGKALNGMSIEDIIDGES